MRRMAIDPYSVRRRLQLWSVHSGAVPLLMCRIVLGWEFTVSGWGKVHRLSPFVGFFRELGIPLPEFTARWVAGCELVCGALLLVGLFSRLATLPLLVTMVVAVATSKQDQIHSLSDLFFQVEVAYICMLFFIAMLGPGAVSLDGLIARWVDRHHRRAVPAVAG
jgi:putative oxidoreductase